MSLKNMLSKLSPFYLPLNYVIEKYVFMSFWLQKNLSFWLQKNMSFWLEKVLLYILKPI